MTGVVTPRREAVVQLTVRGSQGSEILREAIIDTGFTDYLTLPADDIAALGLPYRETIRFELGNGARQTLDIHRGEVRWDGAWRPLLIVSAEGAPLVGMGLVYGSRLTIDAIDGGLVHIFPL